MPPIAPAAASAVDPIRNLRRSMLIVIVVLPVKTLAQPLKSPGDLLSFESKSPSGYERPQWRCRCQYDPALRELAQNARKIPTEDFPIAHDMMKYVQQGERI